MSSSKAGPRQVPPPQRPADAKPANPYARFIPREELQGFASWTPDSFGGNLPPHAQAAAAAAREAGPTPQEIQAQVHAAHQAGYQDGYRDGLVALDSFKQSFAQQMSAQLGALVASTGAELDAMEQQMAAAVARIATQLARQVVRSELTQRPELVAQVATEAVNAVLMSARHITVRVHPEDHPLVAQGAAEALAARGARLVSDPEVARGGCRVDSDVGIVDAQIAQRWAQVATLGADVAWDAPDVGGKNAEALK